MDATPTCPAMARSATAEARPKGEATAGLDHWCYLMYVYILKTESGRERHYVGLSGDPDERLAEHNAGKSPHTAKHRPWVLIAKFWFADEQKRTLPEDRLWPGLLQTPLLTIHQERLPKTPRTERGLHPRPKASRRVPGSLEDCSYGSGHA